MFKDNKGFMTTISARPVKVIKGFQPFFHSESGREVVFPSLSELTFQDCLHPSVFALVAFWAYLCISIFAQHGVFFVADNAYLLVFFLYFISASWMVKTSNGTGDIVSSEINHVSSQVNTSAKLTPSWLIEPLLYIPLPNIIDTVFHVNSLKRIPVSLGRYCLGSIRKTNGDIGNYKRKSAERILLPKHDHYTMKLEQVCLWT
jgi:hypothetical protein